MTGSDIPPLPRRRWGGFSLLETLLAAAILVMILVLFLNMINGTSIVTRRAGDTISSFQEARTAFDVLTRNLSQAILSPIWDYDNLSQPTKYRRETGLHFLIQQAGGDYAGTPGTGQVIYFQAPLGVASNQATYRGMVNLLNACGYFITYGNDAGPFGLEKNYGYRLMQAIQPSENLNVYSSATVNGKDWTAQLAPLGVPLARNIVFLSVWPRKSPSEDPDGGQLSTDFAYNSRTGASSDPQPQTANQLPPIVQVTLVALDDASARRVCVDSSPPAEIEGVFSGLFRSSRTIDFDEDLKKVEARLADKGLNARVFTAAVPLRECKME